MKKKKVTSAAVPSKPTVKVTTPDMLFICIFSESPFVLDPSLTSIELPYSPTISVMPIINALNNSDTVTSVTISRIQWNPQELDELVKCLTENNKSVIKIHGGNEFSTDITNALSKILKANPRIKIFAYQNQTSTSFVAMDGFMSFWNNMAHYNFEELMFSQAYCWTSQLYDLFLESLKFNRSIKAFKMGFEVNMREEEFSKLCDILILKKMTEFWCWSHLKGQTNCDAFKRVLQANYIQKLLIRDKDPEEVVTPINLNVFSEELKNCTSITDLTLISVANWHPALTTIMKDNKTISRLELRFSSVKLQQFLSLDLGSNSTLTDLTICGCYDIKFDLFDDLIRNKTLKRIEFECPYGAPYNADSLQKFLTSNTSLTELILPGYLPNEVIIALADGLRVNRRLQKLTIKFRKTGYKEFNYFIEQLKHNSSLTELNALKVRDIYLDNSPHNGKEADDFFLDLLKSNKNLRHIEGASEYSYLEELLKENRDAQDRGIKEACLTIKMIVARPESFVLPIEIWLRIFSFISFPVYTIDFVKYFNDRIRST